MQAVDGPVLVAPKIQGSEGLDVFLSLFEIPDEIRSLLSKQDIMWIDIARKEQSRNSNDLGDEVSNFLKRYGVRTLRYPRISTSGE
jgi:hypothetical protein